jgi:uncharacterized membrane protein YfcA
VTIWQTIVIFIAGFLAGAINSVAGGGTLVSFPALIWIGIDPKVANVTSTVALWPGSLGGMLGFRRELAGSRKWMLLLAGPSVLGGLIGALLLLGTDSGTFARMVPFLILFATLLFAAGEPMSRRLRRQSDETEAAASGDKQSRAWWAGAAIFQLGVAIYGGYFGAGIGILMLAALGLLGLTDIHQMNGLKNFFALCINIVAALYFMLWGPVEWPSAVIMAAGSIAGGLGGAGLARRLGRRFVRRVVIIIGLAMALSLLVFRR